MRRAARCLVIAGTIAACGRLGFDAHDGGDGGGPMDAPPDAAPAGRWAQVDLGYQTGCGVTTAGELWCWGFGYSGVLGIGGAAQIANPPTRVGTDANWRSVSMADANACGVRTDDSLWCWGDNQHGALGIGQGTSGTYDDPVRVDLNAYRAVGAGDEFGCAIRTDGSLWCWGLVDDGRLGDGADTDEPRPTRVGTDADWDQLSVGEDHACATRTDGSLWCWGYGDDGQLGDDAYTSRDVPTRIAAAHTWRAVAAGVQHTCALDDLGAAWCWGNNNDNEVGTRNDHEGTPARVPGVPALAAIAAHDSGTCGATDAGALYCWGRTDHGQIPGVAEGHAPMPVLVDAGGAVTQLSLGGDTACVVDTDARLRCTGANELGQAGLPFGEVHAPEQSDARTDWAAIWAKQNHTCGRTAAGDVSCWGVGGEGQLGNGDYRDQQVPAAAGAALDRLAMDRDVTAAIGADHALYTWGYDPFNDTYEAEPTQQLDHIAQAALGDDHMCWLTGAGGSGSAGVIYCFGDNSDGQLGAGSGAGSESDTPLALGNTWTALWASADATCATRFTGAAPNDLFCWGADGMTGTVASGSIDTPTQVALATARSAAQVAMAADSVCALLDDATIWCWGENYYGQLGDGTTDFQQTPVQLSAPGPWARLAAGDLHYCAIGTDHSLWCWGHADEGQSGAPFLTDRLTEPVQVGSDTDWADVACGDHYTCALRLDGTRWCFGQNNQGALGNGRSWLTSYAVVP